METKKADPKKIFQSVLIDVQFNREWESPNGTIYYFDVSWENGDVGDMSTSKVTNTNGVLTQSKFVLNKENEYTIEWKTNSKTGEKYMRFNKPQAPRKQSSGTSRGYHQPRNDPERRKRIVNHTSLECALKYGMHFPGNQPLMIAMAFKDWIMSKGEDEGINIAAQGSLKISSNLLSLMTEEQLQKYSDIEKFYSMTNTYFKFIMENE